MQNIDKLRAYMTEHHLDSYLIQKEPNVRYISTFRGADSALLILPETQYILTDARYTEQAAIEAPDFTIVNWRIIGHEVGLQNIVTAEGIQTIGFEADDLVFAEYQLLNEHVTAEFVPASGVIEGFRQIKNETELSDLRNACEIACRAFRRLLPEIRVGVTEKDLAAQLSSYMVAEGADTQPYGNILISGANSSLLHGIPSSKAIEYGDLVLMDFGCQFNGYLSDMTRTVVVGKATAKQKEVYKLEQQMLEVCLDRMKPGVPAADIYRAAREVLAGTGYEDYDYNNIGHGIGMFVHEFPQLTLACDDDLAAGNVITVEPGIYLPGWGGIRIEDQVLVTENGIENMISVPHDLIEL
ncbi:M24 family metallopeptidase [Loigolactobacillus bifermentans]|uniref:Xaa-Pro dipeptidase n=1 Tax=Loigolactobacillus bifermentans DSM 20003 TaxID=1423726 RepID=A0A0R1HB13_9LACO|nr:Xaa-Pro peptidase family protein [Loigolactobacillus bifermentans]KRK40263.1 Xaa-Pro dipeptidase [Loigolactobacillus bifermentans DSM 20003]QGG61735.1 M24 family metallopeptidase [Loigolactobacillus bifermentans]